MYPLSILLINIPYHKRPVPVTLRIFVKYTMQKNARTSAYDVILLFVLTAVCVCHLHIEAVKRQSFYPHNISIPHCPHCLHCGYT